MAIERTMLRMEPERRVELVESVNLKITKRTTPLLKKLKRISNVQHVMKPLTLNSIWIIICMKFILDKKWFVNNVALPVQTTTI